jgi:trehalose 2-sulfotransferase
VDLTRSAEDYARWVLRTPRPTAVARPHQSYFVCATPRCGSWFLCGLLASTGVAGRPHEWFWRDTRKSLEQAWDVGNAEEYLELVLSAGSTPNGVFGAKVMFGALPDLAPFPNPRFVWLRRRDRVAQAVSFAKAVQTGSWHHWDPEPTTQPSYRFDAVDALLREIDDLDACWQRWFEHEGIEPLKLAYESVVADPRAETLRVLEFLSVELPPGVSVRPLTLARPNGSGDEWAERYRDQQASRN